VVATEYPGTNVETKARCPDGSAVADTLAAAGARFEGRLHQTDTYFKVEGMRLKLREYEHRLVGGRNEAGAELIRYSRPDSTGARVSEYVRTPVDDPPARRDELAQRHGIQGVVRKQRDLWLLGSTRIHLDRVEGLGDFVELETVVEGAPGQTDHDEHEGLIELLGIRPEDTLAGSYVDLAGS
jgi:adenylate cyclase